MCFRVNNNISLKLALTFYPLRSVNVMKQPKSEAGGRQPVHSFLSDSMLWYNTVVNHASPRLADGRLGSLLPALWVCLRQMGLCIHLLAPCLPTVRSSQLSCGAHAARLDLSTPQGLFISNCFVFYIYISSTRC